MLVDDVDIVLYHGNCHDGALAASIIKQKTKESCMFVPTWWESMPCKVTGKNVVFVDLTPCPKVLAEVLATARSVFIIDHHESAHAILVTQMTLDMILFDTKECGSTLAWRWIHGPEEPYPALVKYIKALDVFDWTEFAEDARTAMSISRCIEQLVPPTVVDMETALRRGEPFLEDMRQAQQTVDTVIERQIDRCMGSVEYCVLKRASHIRIAVINSQHFINHIAYRIYNAQNVHVVWVWYRHGATQKMRVMLRSNSRFDCQQYALMYGGGGHPNAATFSCDTEISMWGHMWL